MEAYDEMSAATHALDTLHTRGVAVGDDYLFR